MDYTDRPPLSLTSSTHSDSSDDVSKESLPFASNTGPHLNVEKSTDNSQGVTPDEGDSILQALPSIRKSLMDEPLDDNGRDTPQHKKIKSSGQDREDGIISAIRREIGQPIKEQPFKECIPGADFKPYPENEKTTFDVTDRPLSSTKNDHPEKKGKQRESKDMVDGDVHRSGETRYGTKYDKLIKPPETDDRNITTTWTRYEPVKQDQDQMDFKEADDSYDLDSFPRGIFIVINVKEFARRGFDERVGTDIDADNLTELFLDLGFSVERFDNPSKAHIESVMKYASTLDKQCFACAMLSHGDDNKIYGKDCEFVGIDGMLKNFENEKFKGVPKFFIFQACRGAIYMPNIQEHKANETNKKDFEVPDYLLSLPEESDFLCAFANPPGYFSWRRDFSGSWFIQDLVEVFRNEAHQLDVLTMLVRVNEKVANRQSNVPEKAEANKKKEIPSFVCQLTKDLYFHYQPKV